MSGAVPVAATLNVAVCPAVIVALAGCEEIVGATEVTVGSDSATLQTVWLPMLLNAPILFSEEADACSERNTRLEPMVVCTEPIVTYALYVCASAFTSRMKWYVVPAEYGIFAAAV